MAPFLFTPGLGYLSPSGVCVGSAGGLGEGRVGEGSGNNAFLRDAAFSQAVFGSPHWMWALEPNYKNVTHESKLNSLQLASFGFLL